MVGGNPERMVLWPLYFDIRRSRSEGRRVPKNAAVPSPTLDDLARTARSLGIRVKREAECSHPKRPWAKEGRLWVSTSDVKRTLGNDTNKEGLLLQVGKAWREQVLDQRKDERELERSVKKQQSRRLQQNQRRGSQEGKKSSKRRRKR